MSNDLDQIARACAGANDIAVLNCSDRTQAFPLMYERGGPRFLRLWFKHYDSTKRKQYEMDCWHYYSMPQATSRPTTNEDRHHEFPDPPGDVIDPNVPPTPTN